MNTNAKTYESLVEWIAKGTNKQSRPIANNTTARIFGDSVIIKLHSTDIVIIRKDSVTLNSGGWHTLTTKSRMNEFIPYGFSVYQEKNQWYLVKWSDDSRPSWVFKDGITINLPDGNISGAGSLKDEYANDRMKKRINAYVEGYISALFDGNVKSPDAGDCWHCYMREVSSNRPLGEVIKSTDHLTDHMDEKYYVPSLLVNAIESFPVSQAAKWTIAALWIDDKETVSAFGSIAKIQIKSSLKRYLYRSFGLAS